jgi:histidine ammonia-lyase
MQEDHVSMAWGAVRKLRTVIDNVTAIVAIETVCAARAIALRAPLVPAVATAAAIDRLRDVVPGPGPDRHLAPEVAAATSLVRSGALLDAAQSVIGPLQ